MTAHWKEDMKHKEHDEGIAPGIYTMSITGHGLCMQLGGLKEALVAADPVPLAS